MASTMQSNGIEKGSKRPRRSFTDEFKAGAVALVLDEGKTVAEVARDLDLTPTSFRNWVERARADRGKGKPGVLNTPERDALVSKIDKILEDSGFLLSSK